MVRRYIFLGIVLPEFNYNIKLIYFYYFRYEIAFLIQKEILFIEMLLNFLSNISMNKIKNKFIFINLIDPLVYIVNMQ